MGTGNRARPAVARAEEKQLSAPETGGSHRPKWKPRRSHGAFLRGEQAKHPKPRRRNWEAACIGQIQLVGEYIEDGPALGERTATTPKAAASSTCGGAQTYPVDWP